MESENGSGKVKLTVELEINQAAMDLIKENTGTMVNAVSQSVSALRSGSKNGSKLKHDETSVAGIVHPGQEVTQ
jgi:NAD-dependent DNA ligase